MEKRVSVRKTFVSLAQNKCSEAEIFNDLQPEQCLDNLFILDSVGKYYSETQTKEFNADMVTLKTSICKFNNINIHPKLYHFVSCLDPFLVINAMFSAGIP